MNKRNKRRCMGLSERGAAAVFVAVSIIGLLGMTAFSFDFGRVYVERRELQVGAEAAALAIARDCAQGACPTDVVAEAEIYADANARDGAAWVQSVNLDMDAQSVEVVTGNEDADGNRNFDMTFGQIVGVDSYTVGAQASAVWGPPGTLGAMPLIFSECEWLSFGEPGFVDENPLGFLHRSSAVHDGLLPPAGGYAYESEYATIYFHGQQGDCHYNPSGQDLPGGFGWLQTGVNPNQLCEIEVSSETWQAVDPGSSPSNGCNPVDFTNMVGSVQLIPYFDDHQGTGNNAEYHISGFGAFYVTGYYFAGQFRERSVIDNQFPCGGNERCIQGYFIGDWVASGGGGVGGGNDHGLDIVGLSG